MSDLSYPTFPILALLGFALVLIPFPWHLQAWNSGTCLYMFWTAVGCLLMFVNSIVWHNNALIVAPVWCDISTRLTVGISVALPAASLCINRRLYHITQVQAVSIDRAEKRKAVMVDVGIGLGLPILQMILQIIVEGHRFNILEDIGCYPFTINTPLAYPISIIWPVVIGLVSSVYCVLTLRSFFHRRAQFAEVITSNSSLTVNRYFRLMALATMDVILTVPISAYGIYLNVTANNMSPWKGWSDAHFDFARIDQIPAVIWRINRTNEVSVELSRWLLPFSAFVFFAFFGFASEARRHYRQAALAVWRKIGGHTLSSKNSSRKLVLPSFIQQDRGSLPVYIRAPHPLSSNTSVSSSFDSEKTFPPSPKESMKADTKPGIDISIIEPALPASPQRIPRS